jgi:hypothetical protein
MFNKNARLMIAILALSISQGTQAEGWLDTLQGAVDTVSKHSDNEIVKSSLANSDMVDGLKEALANGVETAIKTLGQPGGFAGNQLVKIAVPDSLKTIVATARTLGQGQYIDSFESTMNQAAEKAVPEAAVILADAIRQMSVDDAMNIVNGPDDSATQYFRKMAESSLAEKFKPIVNQATEQAGVTAAYKNLTGLASNPLVGSLLGGSSLDLDQYVTNEALDGLFKYIAIEEKRIRDNPAARTTDLLKKVFGG